MKAAIAIEEEKRRLESEAEAIAEDVQVQQEQADKQRQAVEQANAKQSALKKKLKAMEDKILMGEAKGGLLEVAKSKEAELKARQEVLQRR